MKNIIKQTQRFVVLMAILLLSSVLFVVSGCEKSETTPQNETKSENEILQSTKWKLIETSITKDSQQAEIVDYSEMNIIYDFATDKKLIIEGEIEPSFIFYDFLEGEHLYEYTKPIFSPTVLPGKNLTIDEPKLGQEEGHYYCIVELENKTMRIIGDITIDGDIDDNGLITGGDYYKWEKVFVQMD